MKATLPSTILAALFVTLGCYQKKDDPIITIVNIGQNNRIALGKQIGIIKKHSPKIIGLDFLLVPDSLEKDDILVRELETAENTVQVVGLHYSPDQPYVWDFVEESHPKFKAGDYGFANLTTNDSMLVKVLPMVQTFNTRRIFSFSYVVAKNSFGVKDEFKTTSEKEFDFDLNGLGKNYNLISPDELLSGRYNPGDLEGKIVLMGYIGPKGDYFYLDRQGTRKINGVEVHAALVEELINRE